MNDNELFTNEPKLTGHVFKIKGNKLWTLSQGYYDELKDTFPLKDVEREMRAAKLWCKNVSASKRKTAVGMNRFLGGWVSRSESDGHVTVDPEKSHSELVYEKNLKGHIDRWSNVIMERTPGELKANKMFMAASQYPEFAAWAIEKRPDLKGAKPDKVNLTKPIKAPARIAPEVPKTKITPVVCVETAPVSSDADLPPPDDPVKAAMLRKFIKDHDLF